jgi:hypothetical protein
LTPYTFYNHNADLLVQSSSVLKIKEEVLNYESFYKNNTWRQQGAAIDFALQFPKVVDEVKVNAFITRLNPSNFGTILERLYGGGNVIFTQSKYLTLGFNHVSIFDLKNTALNENAYRNNVSSVSYKATIDLKKHIFGLSGESGFSSSALSLDTTGGLSIQNALSSGNSLQVFEGEEIIGAVNSNQTQVESGLPYVGRNVGPISPFQ